jgi:hypothetical protein
VSWARQAIRDNEALPLSFIINLAENALIDDWFFKDTLDSALRLGSLPKKAVLSDRHEFLKSFYQLNEFQPFLCHRHLIKTFQPEVLSASL